jgi:pimeloyl-ACP methyl ester carboxylesterase
VRIRDRGGYREGVSESITVEPFAVHIEPSVLDDLRDRIARTRFPDAIAGAGWEYGMDPDYLRGLLDSWAGEFDWYAQERALNRCHHYRAHIDGLRVHVIHERGAGPDPLPIVLTHGWPSSFVEHLELLPLLADPAAHGGRAEDAFDVVVTSLPGYGFSDRPTARGMLVTTIADLWHRLMTDGLGYPRYVAHGSDIGARVTAELGRRHPGSLLGIHLSALSFSVPPRPWSPAEAEFLTANDAWWQEEGAYGSVQGTKPQTLAYGLNDSPAGLAAWIVEKFWARSDCGGDVESRFSRDQLLTNLTIYWATQTANSSMRLYYERRHQPAAETGRVTVPTGFAIFANEYKPEGRPPRELAERTFNVARWTDLDRGGHFAALEEPQLLAREIREFFRPYRAGRGG